MENPQLPGELNVSGEVGVNWKQWRWKFEIYMNALHGITKEDAVKVAILSNVIGDEALQVYESWEPTPEEKKDYNAFNKRALVKGRKNDLRKLSATSEFGNLSDSLIMDHIVGGVCDSKIRDRMFLRNRTNSGQGSRNLQVG
ncbi:hypothetical protein PR048_015519 [Dryococelus australis]|uniref:Uncharacterized protein n=1 Tax=Dryococelus australis TaxID=614101 RepID=A0ABQ9HH57_9NEOP|nr:hypothetical protein PR048_015519 [Dryococelus australis]